MDYACLKPSFERLSITTVSDDNSLDILFADWMCYLRKG